MSKQQEAMRLALEALYEETAWFGPTPKGAAAITALRDALAEPVQEPAPMPPFPPVSQWKRGCAVCGLGADGKAYGYACPRSDCPTRVTCGRG